MQQRQGSKHIQGASVFILPVELTSTRKKVCLGGEFRGPSRASSKGILVLRILNMHNNYSELVNEQAGRAQV